MSEFEMSKGIFRSAGRLYHGATRSLVGLTERGFEQAAEDFFRSFFSSELIFGSGFTGQMVTEQGWDFEKCVRFNDLATSGLIGAIEKDSRRIMNSLAQIGGMIRVQEEEAILGPCSSG